jgi:hypothetical protein
MYLETLCTPAVLFVMIMIFHLIFELYDKNYSMALAKLVASIFMILFLQLLCMLNMEIIGWMIVFLPLIIYTYMTIILFFVFGTHPEEAIRRFEVTR